MIGLLHVLLMLCSGPERENHRGVEAWNRRDTTAALKRFESASRQDSSQSDYAFNSGTLKSLAGKDGEADFARAIARASDPEAKARALYNRGTARLRKAVSAPPGQGDPNGAISDLRDALRLKPGWNEASRNLDRALRLRPPPQKDKDPKPKDQPKDGPKDKKDPPPQGGQDERKPSEDRDQAPPQGMDPRDAERLMDGAAAREAQQAKQQSRKPREESDAPDW